MSARVNPSVELCHKFMILHRTHLVRCIISNGTHILLIVFALTADKDVLSTLNVTIQYGLTLKLLVR